jgi:two-component system, NarL family, sensor kinase
MASRNERLLVVLSAVVPVTGAAVFVLVSTWGGRPFPLGNVPWAALPIVWWAVGASIALRAGGHRIGRLLTVVGVVAGCLVGGIGFLYSPTLPAAPWAILLVTAAYGPLFVGIILGSMVLFPDGHLPTPAWRLPVLVPVSLVLVATVALALRAGPFGPGLPDNPLGIEGLPAGLLGSGYVLDQLGIALLGIVGAVSLTWRFRRGNPKVRAQLKWLLASVIPVVILIPISFFEAEQSTSSLADFFSAFALLLVPVSIGISITRYRLYDIDVVINRALVYSVLGLLVAAAYLVLATALGRLAGGDGSPATATLATVLAALVALAARQAVQQAIGRLLYGRRGDPLAVIGSVARRLESAGTPEGLLTDVVGDLREALKLDAVAVYAVDGALLAGTAHVEEGSRLSLAHQGEPVGELRVWTARGDELKPGDLRLLQDLGPQLGVAIEAVRLKRDLQRARERLVAALEDERRRLRRDLHDGLGPTLTAITLRADAATNLLARDPARARELLDELRGAAGDAIAEVRQLVHGLRPMALDELGLVGAIREQGIGVDRAGMPGPEVEIDDGIELPPLPAAVEVAAYRIATEAITNAIRHAGARHCRVRIIANTALEVEVTDDGHGWEGRLTPGVGIQSMRERAADLGGTLTIAPVPGGGTSVLARLPLTTGSAS